ncbi:hypothetical protein [Vibrio parahaemolyticus]|uniref:hypothetical protein n=1 Tax=Vibrio harveyi group TaxID=717610 RepID=UPI00112134B4|nr:hypothetical protein [Vibrio parahaemolyticus]EHQ9271133.1 hypothetical protein [Vibrio parahaemolyticus]MCX8799659.1 hypothetical protein [Vibrio parahaemolyticus]MDS1787179.1 hypothetical protein [Vibrio parahaemolyticus]TOG81363.1 hypothetical protein CGI93_21355 [Vibrio parahaemolyticus]HCK0618433.1 hypothetical protein [Vibrio parahaemolyticus]
MRFLKLRTDHNRTRRDGTRYVTPLIVDSPRRFAPSRDRKETSLRRKQCQLITGAHDSGKSRWLTRLKDNRHEIWGKKTQPVLLEGLMPLSSWVEVKGIDKWYQERQEEDVTYTPWSKLNLQLKADQLSDYLMETQSLLFIDDAHKLTGRKAQIARKCLMSAKLWLMTCSEEGRLPPSIRPIVERREPQRINLESDVSYDTTKALVWFMVALCVVAGAWEAGAVIGGLQMLGSGRRSTRAD